MNINLPDEIFGIKTKDAHESYLEESKNRKDPKQVLVITNSFIGNGDGCRKSIGRANEVYSLWET